MRISSLEVYGVHPDLLAAWERANSPELLPVQEAAVKLGVLDGQSIIVCSPTGSGKTFIGEMAAVRAARLGRKVVFLVPTKALAEAKYESFLATYGPLGLKARITTRDRRLDDAAIMKGDFDILVTIPEKLRAMLSRTPALARQFGVVVADELQLLGDEHRGPCYELLLTDLRTSCDAAALQVIGLSAVLSNPEAIAAWLDAAPLCLSQRPIDLHKGAIVEGVYSFHKHNSGEAGRERLLSDPPEEDEGVLGALVRRFAADEEPTLIFVRDKATCMRLAATLAEEIEQAGLAREAEDTGTEIADFEPNAIRRQLQIVLRAGVGFHNADMQLPERRAVERGFLSGDIRVLCATSSLAMGVHLPARNVIIDPCKWDSAGAGPGALRPISRAEFENMAGRAGRPGYGDAPGRALMLAETDFVADALMERYVNGDAEPICSRLMALPITDRVLQTAGGVAALAKGLRHTYARTLAATSGDIAWGAEEEATAQRLHAEGLLSRRLTDETWRVTPLGRLCGASGLSFAGFKYLLDWARQSSRAPGDLLALAIAALSPDATDKLPISAREMQSDELARQFGCGLSGEDAQLCERLLYGEEIDRRERLRATKQALALMHWAGWDETEEIERTLRATAGRLALVGESLGWLVQTLGEIGRQLGWPREDAQRLERLATQVSAGLPAEAAALEVLLREGLARGEVLRLAREGHQHPAEAREALGATQRTGEPRQVAPARARSKQPERPKDAALEVQIDATRPDRIVFRGLAIAVSPTQYKLMRVLAETPGACVAYDDIYEAVWGQDEFVEPSQVNWHRGRLVHTLATSPVGGRAPIPIRTIPRSGLVLDLPASQVAVS